jgi:hypothetical protein
VIAIFNNNEKKAGKETKFDFERGRKEYHFSYTSSSTYSY